MNIPPWSFSICSLGRGRHLHRDLRSSGFPPQVLIKPKPVFQAAVVSEQTRQLVTEALQNVTRSAELVPGPASGADGSAKGDSGSAAGEASHSSAPGERGDELQ